MCHELCPNRNVFVSNATIIVSPLLASIQKYHLYLCGHTIVDAFREHAPRWVHRKFALILFEQLLVIFRQRRNFVKILDLCFVVNIISDSI